MGDFETIPASSRPEKPEEEKKEEKPVVEAVDWDSDLPAEEPAFVTEDDEATRLSTPKVEASEPVPPIASEAEVIEPPDITPAEGTEPPKKKKTWLIILIVALVLLCLCCVVVMIASFFVADAQGIDFGQLIEAPLSLLV